jgi:hypothetical protein
MNTEMGEKSKVFPKNRVENIMYIWTILPTWAKINSFVWINSLSRYKNVNLLKVLQKCSVDSAHKFTSLSIHRLI